MRQLILCWLINWSKESSKTFPNLLYNIIILNWWWSGFKFNLIKWIKIQYNPYIRSYYAILIEYSSYFPQIHIYNIDPSWYIRFEAEPKQQGSAIAGFVYRTTQAAHRKISSRKSRKIPRDIQSQGVNSRYDPRCVTDPPPLSGTAKLIHYIIQARQKLYAYKLTGMERDWCTRGDPRW